MSDIKYFQIDEDTVNSGRWRVVYWITCYADKFGEDAYPASLEMFARSGMTYFLVLAKDEDGNYLEDLDRDEALDLVDEMEERFADIIEECENAPDWDALPEELEFDFNDVIYYK